VFTPKFTGRQFCFQNFTKNLIFFLRNKKIFRGGVKVSIISAKKIKQLNNETKNKKKVIKNKLKKWFKVPDFIVFFLPRHLSMFIPLPLRCPSLGRTRRSPRRTTRETPKIRSNPRSQSWKKTNWLIRRRNIRPSDISFRELADHRQNVARTLQMLC